MSRNAIKGSEPIESLTASNVANAIISNIKSMYNIECCTLGSTGKKKPGDFSGDIDIAIQMEFNDININKARQMISKFYPGSPVYISYGFKIVSFGYCYMNNDEPMIAQVDLMFSNDIKYSQFMYHSPNYRLDESMFKGLYRTNLLCYIAGRVPTDKEDVYENGELMDYWKYTLTYDNGLVIHHKTYRGKTKRLSMPQTVKEDTVFISKDPNYIVKLILGDNARVRDTNSFESLIKYLMSDNYKYKEMRQLILDDYFEDPRHDSKHNELINYMLTNISGVEEYVTNKIYA